MRVPAASQTVDWYRARGAEQSRHALGEAPRGARPNAEDPTWTLLISQVDAGGGALRAASPALAVSASTPFLTAGGSRSDGAPLRRIASRG